MLDGPYTLILADPPYALGAVASLEGLVGRGLADSGKTILVLEHSSREDAPERLGGLSQGKTLRHGDSAVSIYR